MKLLSGVNCHFLSVTAREQEIEDRQKESMRTDDHSGWRRGGVREEKEKGETTTDGKEEGGERSSVWRAGGEIGGWAQGTSTQLQF